MRTARGFCSAVGLASVGSGFFWLHFIGKYRDLYLARPEVDPPRLTMQVLASGGWPLAGVFFLLALLMLFFLWRGMARRALGLALISVFFLGFTSAVLPVVLKKPLEAEAKPLQEQKK